MATTGILGTREGAAASAALRGGAAVTHGALAPELSDEKKGDSR
jgi:hypothetical protein